MRTTVITSISGKVDEKATQLHAIASLKVLLDATAPHKGAATASSAYHLKETALVNRPLSEPNGIAIQTSSWPELERWTGGGRWAKLIAGDGGSPIILSRSLPIFT
ncbi:unnamed protein product [Nezara viridula]|uniref:Uncharacterized protein n=1 Tax=Nezara viridula TaxID=85310 RepID=A0A9P0H3F8_NEZVI|nr:unnamed protein product [Nezara viridula]